MKYINCYWLKISMSAKIPYLKVDYNNYPSEYLKQINSK